MGYEMNMRNENRDKFELPDGWYAFEIAKIEEYPSKKCQLMFKAKMILADNAGVGTDVYFVGDEGKRWFLKELLASCSCPAAEDGVYNWDFSDVEGHTVWGRVEHRQGDDWYDRDGKKQPGRMKAQISEFKPFGVNKPA